MAKPSVGRVVHYVSYGTPIRADGSQAYVSLCRAAIVSEVDPQDPDRVGLVAINPTGLFFHALADGGCVYHGGDYASPESVESGAPSVPSYDGGSWHWPERVDQ